MSKSARAACRELRLDCCKVPAGTAHATPQPQVPDVLLFPAVPMAAAATDHGSLAASLRSAPLPPAFLQGLGLYTLFAAFLI